MRTLNRIAIGALAMLALTTGCGKKNDTNARVDSSTVGQTSTPTQSNATISSLSFGKHVDPSTKDLTDQTTTFGKKDTIHAVVKTDNAPEGATITAKWTYPSSNQTVHQETTSLAQGSNTTHFHIEKPSGWPTGEYRLDVTVGNATQSGTVKVQ